MAYEREFLRFTAQFQDSSSEEIAETGFTLAGNAGWNALTALASASDANIASMASTLGTVMAASPFTWGEYSGVYAGKLAAIGTDGHYLDDPRVVALAPTGTSPIVLGSHNNVCPQLSVEIGLWSGHKLSRANYGKMYLPHTFLALVDMASVASTTDAVAASAAMAAYLSAVNGIAGGWTGAPILQVMSKVGAGQTKPVLWARCGVVNDTQRKRRDKLPELQQATAVTGG